MDVPAEPPISRTLNGTELQVPIAEDRTDLEVSSQPSVGQRIHNDGDTAPRSLGRSDDLPSCDGLSTGVDPVVDEQDTRPRREEISPQAEFKIPVLVVRRRSGGKPAVAVGRRFRVLTKFDQTDAELDRDKCP